MTDFKSDPLENKTLARLVAGSSVIALGFGFYLSADRADPKKLPGVALDSPFLFDLERAFVIGALFAATLIFLIRGWNGYYPSKVSTTGAEYPEREAVEQVTKGSDVTTAAVEAMRAQQLEIAKAARDDFNLLKGELNALEERIDRGDAK